MTLSINISPELESQLKAAAFQRGLNEADYARQLIEKDLTSAAPSGDRAMLDLLAKWRARS
jgi:hypothetical protein